MLTLQVIYLHSSQWYCPPADTSVGRKINLLITLLSSVGGATGSDFYS